MRLRFFTVWFEGAGSINCNQCSMTLFLPEDAKGLLIDDGYRIRLLSATDAAVMHLCGRVLEWRCVDCGELGRPRQRRVYRAGFGRRMELDAVCGCGGPLVQREL